MADSETKGYLPPEGPQSTHQTNYRYNEVQGAHRVGNSTIYGPPEAIVTGSGVAQRECERRGFEEISGDVVAEYLEADTTEAKRSIIDDYLGGDAADSSLLDGTVEEIEDALATGEHDDELDELDAAEFDGDDRTGVHDAIDARRDGIADDEEAEE